MVFPLLLWLKLVDSECCSVGKLGSKPLGNLTSWAGVFLSVDLLWSPMALASSGRPSANGVPSVAVVRTS